METLVGSVKSLGTKLTRSLSSSAGKAPKLNVTNLNDGLVKAR